MHASLLIGSPVDRMKVVGKETETLRGRDQGWETFLDGPLRVFRNRGAGDLPDTNDADGNACCSSRGAQYAFRDKLRFGVAHFCWRFTVLDQHFPGGERLGKDLRNC